MWESTGPHYCTACEPSLNRRIDKPLNLIKRNYSGCNVDIGQCEKCERYFQISYKVDKVLDITEQVKL